MVFLLPSSPVPKEGRMDVEGAMLMMAVFDYDMVGSNDLCGLCVIPCKRIPKVGNKGSITKPTGPERKNYRLPLFKVQSTTAFRWAALVAGSLQYFLTHTELMEAIFLKWLVNNVYLEFYTTYMYISIFMGFYKLNQDLVCWFFGFTKATTHTCSFSTNSMRLLAAQVPLLTSFSPSLSIQGAGR